MPKHKRGRRRKPFKLHIKKYTLYSIISAVLISSAALIIISFSKQSRFLQSINNILKSLFGITTPLLPFFLISVGLLFSRIKSSIAKPNISLGAFIILISLMTITQSGTIGQSLGYSLTNAITKTGSIIISLSLLLIGLIILFETSFDEIFTALSSLLPKIKQKPKNLRFKKNTNSETKQPTIKVKAYEPSPSQTIKEEPSPSSSSESASISLPLPNASDKIWHYPPLSLLSKKPRNKADRGDLNKNAATIENTLESFGIKTNVVEVNCGPTVTQYALEIALGTKLSKVTALSNDLALALAAPTGQIRIEAPIPGRSLIGIEIPNKSPEYVTLYQMLNSAPMKKSQSKLAIGLGLDVSGKPIIDNITKMPHALIAGATGSGKSVFINSIICHILFRSTPNEVKLILVDPKRVELTQYNDIPHLLSPVITEPKKVVSALKWATQEMERRYKIFAKTGSRNIKSYNQMSGFQALPYIMIIIDELADIMLFAPSEVEDLITRIAQMARATGIHLIISTQRPSVDVLTGLIKANIPCRIAFNVSSMIDSRVIIDSPGAEKLLGKGDMLYIPPNQAKPTRIQAPFVSDKEISNLISYLKKIGTPEYSTHITDLASIRISPSPTQNQPDRDELFAQAVKTIVTHKRASASLLQRRLQIGYARAARILDQLQASGIVSPPQGSKPRQVNSEKAKLFLTEQI